MLEDVISFWGLAYFQGRSVSFREGICMQVVDKNYTLIKSYQITI